MLNKLSFFISEAFIGMRRSALMMFIAIGTISVSLVIFGVFLLINANLSNLGNFVTAKLEIRAFLQSDISDAERMRFKTILEQMPYVKTVVFVDKNEAWKNFRTNYPNLELAEIVTDNPLPDAFKIVLSDNKHITELAGKIKSYNTYVEDVVYGGSIAERMSNFSRLVRIAGFILVIFLTLATLFIIVNTIRLTVLNREDEIAIMKLVGATNAFISGPFIIEGLLIGLSGSLIASGVLKYFYGVFASHFQTKMPYFPIVFDPWALNKIYLSIIALGIFLGILGAYISISKILKRTI